MAMHRLAPLVAQPVSSTKVSGFSTREDGVHPAVGVQAIARKTASRICLAAQVLHGSACHHSTPGGAMANDVSDKKCPYCAKTIQVESTRCGFCGSVLTQPADAAAVRSADANGTVCAHCNVALVPTRVRKMASPMGILGIGLVAVGLVSAPFWFGRGFLIILVGAWVCYVGGKKTVMVCPNCGSHGGTIAP
jgi:hypothetical protein